MYVFRTQRRTNNIFLPDLQTLILCVLTQVARIAGFQALAGSKKNQLLFEYFFKYSCANRISV